MPLKDKYGSHLNGHNEGEDHPEINIWIQHDMNTVSDAERLLVFWQINQASVCTLHLVRHLSICQQWVVWTTVPECPHWWRDEFPICLGNTHHIHVLAVEPPSNPTPSPPPTAKQIVLAFSYTDSVICFPDSVCLDVDFHLSAAGIFFFWTLPGISGFPAHLLQLSCLYFMIRCISICW